MKYLMIGSPQGLKQMTGGRLMKMEEDTLIQKLLRDTLPGKSSTLTIFISTEPNTEYFYSLLEKVVTSNSDIYVDSESVVG